MHEQLTEAVRRILADAASLAGVVGEPTISPEGLLWALVRDESRGSEILRQSAITWDSFLGDRPELPSEVPVDVHIRPVDPLLMLSRLSQDVLTAAAQQASEAGRHAEIGSEHLLWGLLIVDSEASAYLRERGLTEAFVFAKLPEHSGFDTTPLVVEEILQTKATPASEQADAWRILDAAANRCSEGLRVVEDVVRFARNDPFGARLLKEFRHEFNVLLALLPAARRLEMRDSSRDVGTTLSTKSEGSRGSLRDVLAANFKRSEEALRSLEEVSKLFGAELLDFTRGIEALRYRFYTVEKTILRSLAVDLRLSEARVYLLVTRELCAAGAERVICESIVNGVDVIQLREKSLNDREFVRYAREAREWTARHGKLLIVNDRPDVAALCDADGVHLGQEDLAVGEARRILGPGALVGVSTHAFEQARQAVLDGADYLGAGPVYPSGTKDFPEGCAGLDYLRQVAAEVTIPWFAIGGIAAENLAAVVETGARRIAVCGAICGAAEPGAAAAELSRAWNALG